MDGRIMKYKHKPTIVKAVECKLDGIHYQGNDMQHFKYGDYLVTGVKGEDYIVRKDIFNKLYEKVREKIKEVKYRHRGSGEIVTTKYYEEFKVYLVLSDSEYEVISEKEFELTYSDVK
ncbi:MAG: hypothetical protein OXC46_04315 [Thaumarchaeota archaeon]|nr:hypothetical protein [Nitrososphaerota archaeon]